MMVVCFTTLMTEFHPDEIGMNTPWQVHWWRVELPTFSQLQISLIILPSLVGGNLYHTKQRTS